MIHANEGANSNSESVRLLLSENRPITFLESDLREVRNNFPCVRMSRPRPGINPAPASCESCPMC